MNQKLSKFDKEINGKKVAVIGIARTNTPLIEFLCKRGARVTAFDKSSADELESRLAPLKGLDVEYRLGPGYLSGLSGFDWIFRTPIVRPDIPEFAAELARGAILSSEMELFLELCPATVFGVTGSDGKTTTTTLIYEMLKAHGYDCYLGGNIGNPLIGQVERMTAADMAVLELSSFQLMTFKESVNVAVITNLSPNHLDVHKSYEEYVNAKKNIFLHQSPDDLCVLNYNDEQTAALSSETPGRLGFFSPDSCGAFAGGEYAQDGRSDAEPYLAGRSDAEPHLAGRGDVKSRLAGSIEVKPDCAAYAENGRIYFHDYSVKGGAREPSVTQLINADDIRIPGRHNLENYLAAICAVKRYVNCGDILATARGFGGVEHRIEYIRTLDGVKYYNDSIASSPSRTIACLNTFDQKIILIAGGKDKNLDFEPLGRKISEKVKLLILCGATADKIKESLKNFCEANTEAALPPVIECDNYEDAVDTAHSNAKAGDIVALSPAGASFDRFRDFEERGRVFKKLVNALH